MSSDVNDLQISQVAVELTDKCQLSCIHCYADSSPQRGHGTMTTGDWRRTIDETAAIGAEEIQFIGGEPTLHPDFAPLVEYALAAGLRVDVFSNLVRVRASWWPLLEDPRVTVGTSYYAGNARSHQAVTGRRGSYSQTRRNIAEAVARGVQIRASIVDLGEAEAARAELASLGVERVRVGALHAVGRANDGSPLALCGHCGVDRISVSSSGDVSPCVITRMLTFGNVRTVGLSASLARLRRWFTAHRTTETCCPGD